VSSVPLLLHVDAAGFPSRTLCGWYIMAENEWYIFAEKHWYIVAENGWHTIAENRWHTYGRKLTKAMVAIARKLLVAVWHVLSKGCADRFADPERVARKLLDHAYRLGPTRRPQGQTAAQYVRQQLDRLGLGAELAAIPLGKTRRIVLPPSQLGANAN
jgi:hypothetical protein